MVSSRERRGGVSRPAPPTWPEVAWLSPSWPGRAEARRASWRGLEGARRASRPTQAGCRRASWRGLGGARRAWSPGPGALRAGRFPRTAACSSACRHRTWAGERLPARAPLTAGLMGRFPRTAAIRSRRLDLSGCRRPRPVSQAAYPRDRSRHSARPGRVAAGGTGAALCRAPAERAADQRELVDCPGEDAVSVGGAATAIGPAGGWLGSAIRTECGPPGGWTKLPLGKLVSPTSAVMEMNAAIAPAISAVEATPPEMYCNARSIALYIGRGARDLNSLARRSTHDPLGVQETVAARSSDGAAPFPAAAGVLPLPAAPFCIASAATAAPCCRRSRYSAACIREIDQALDLGRPLEQLVDLRVAEPLLERAVLRLRVRARPGPCSVRVAHIATSPPLSFDIEPWPPVIGMPLRPIHDARWIRSRAASISVATSASRCWFPWRSSGGLPAVELSSSDSAIGSTAPSSR